MQNNREAIKTSLTILGESELVIVALPQLFYICMSRSELLFGIIEQLNVLNIKVAVKKERITLVPGSAL